MIDSTIPSHDPRKILSTITARNVDVGRLPSAPVAYGPPGNAPVDLSVGFLIALWTHFTQTGYVQTGSEEVVPLGKFVNSATKLCRKKTSKIHGVARQTASTMLTRAGA
jgi:hypothetical protein